MSTEKETVAYIKEVYTLVDKYLGYEPQGQEDFYELEMLIPHWKAIYNVIMEEVNKYEQKS